MSGSGISWAICKSAARSKQITTPTPHYSVFTGRMPFLPPNQQCQSTEGTEGIQHNVKAKKSITTKNYLSTFCYKITNNKSLERNSTGTFNNKAMMVVMSERNFYKLHGMINGTLELSKHPDWFVIQTDTDTDSEII